MSCKYVIICVCHVIIYASCYGSNFFSYCFIDDYIFKFERRNSKLDIYEVEIICNILY